MSPWRTSLSVPPSMGRKQQIQNFPDALKRDCPVCIAKAGEPCMPASLAIPHLARCRDEERGSAA